MLNFRYALILAVLTSCTLAPVSVRAQGVFERLFGNHGSTPLPLTPAPRCHELLLDEPPFYLSSVKLNRQDSVAVGSGGGAAVRATGRGPKPEETLATEAVFAGARPDFRRARYLPRGSRVRPVSVLDLDGPAKLIQVEVLKPSETYDQALKTAPIRSGDRGYVARDALRPAGRQDVLLLRRDAYFMKFGTLSDRAAEGRARFPSGTALTPKMSLGKYVAVLCDGSYTPSYLFDAVPPPGSSRRFQVSTVYFGDAPACINATSLHQDHLEELLRMDRNLRTIYGARWGSRLGDLEINDWGMVRLPTRPVQGYLDATEIAEDGSFLHYQGADRAGTDTWGQPHAVCAFTRIARDWFAYCRKSDTADRCRILIGDMAFITPAKAAGTEQDPLGHHYHHRGTCLDMRPFRKDGVVDKQSVLVNGGLYDRPLTRKFIEFILKRGATPVYFSDPTIYRDRKLGAGSIACNSHDMSFDVGRKVQPCGGHENHIHFCLEEGQTDGCD